MHICISISVIRRKKCAKLREIYAEVGMDDSDSVYNEACRLVGESCLMLARNGDEISRAQVAYQLKRIHWQIMEQTGESNLAIKLAVEQLEDGLEK